MIPVDSSSFNLTAVLEFNDIFVDFFNCFKDGLLGRLWLVLRLCLGRFIIVGTFQSRATINLQRLTLITTRIRALLFRPSTEVAVYLLVANIP